MYWLCRVESRVEVWVARVVREGSWNRGLRLSIKRCDYWNYLSISVVFMVIALKLNSSISFCMARMLRLNCC